MKPQVGYGNLPDILEALGSPERTGRDQSYVAKDYSISGLIYDLRNINEQLTEKEEENTRLREDANQLPNLLHKKDQEITKLREALERVIHSDANIMLKDRPSEIAKEALK